jgi:hypothetical protein
MQAHPVYRRRSHLQHPFPYPAGNSRRAVLAGSTSVAVDTVARMDLEVVRIRRVLVDSLVDTDLGYHNHIGLEVGSPDNPGLVGLLDLHRSAQVVGNPAEGHLALSTAHVSTSRSFLRMKHRGMVVRMTCCD